jgi:hypothetical protein
MRDTFTDLESPFFEVEPRISKPDHEACAGATTVARESPFEQFSIELETEWEERTEIGRAFDVSSDSLQILGESSGLDETIYDHTEIEEEADPHDEIDFREEPFPEQKLEHEWEKPVDFEKESRQDDLETHFDEPYLQEEDEEYGVELEDEDSQLQPLAGYDARIVNNKARTDSTPAEVALIVDRWESAESAKVNAVRFKLYECDAGETGRSDSAASKDAQMADLTFDLVPNPEYVKNPNKAGIPRVAVVNAKWDNAALEKSYKATTKPDVILWLGSRTFRLWIPREDILEEGNAVELGFVIEDGEGHKIQRTSIAQGHTASVSIPDYLAVLLGIPGRFDDPKREPAVDMDGMKFDEFLKGSNRRECIRKWLDGHAALKKAASEPNADLKTTDILKAWFVIHDVGVKSSLTDKRFKARDAATKNGAVHGFVNRGGYFAATHDFTKNRQGTVYEFLSKYGQKHVNGRTINVETVPDIEADVPDKKDGLQGDPSNVDLYASIGYRRKGKKVTYYKWTKEAFDVLADLYIFASIRARHLLTITVHKEMDRNLGRSVIWREYSAAEVQAGAGKFWDTVRNSPSNYHGDPYGFNMQALYDRITQKLNALGGKQMPSGARYGIHPRRVSKPDGEDIGNGDSHKHEFPHQSDPNLETDTSLKKAGWWNS